jgi:hypothetical protein
LVTLTGGAASGGTAVASISGAPVAPAHLADDLRFSSSEESKTRTLSDRPTFLTLTADAFQLPQTPANSSQQTRAEIEYLLRLSGIRDAVVIGFAKNSCVQRPNAPLVYRSV